MSPSSPFSIHALFQFSLWERSRRFRAGTTNANAAEFPSLLFLPLFSSKLFQYSSPEVFAGIWGMRTLNGDSDDWEGAGKEGKSGGRVVISG